MKSLHPKLIAALTAFANDESGQDLVEYALVVALVMLGAVAALQNVTQSIGTVFTGVGSALTSAL